MGRPRRSWSARTGEQGAVDADRPWFILHRAGNDRRAWQRAVASPADYLEVDVWLHGARPQEYRIASHHDPLIHSGLPFLTQRHRLPRLRLPWRALWLDEARAPRRIFLDIKDPRPGAIPAILRALATSGGRQGATASTSIWPQLDILAERAPDLGRFYTVRRADGGEASWTAYLRRIEEGRGGAGVSLHQRLATPERLQGLRERGLRAICYTVNDYDAGLRLLELGAGGLISDRADLIPRWRDRWEPRV